MTTSIIGFNYDKCGIYISNSNSNARKTFIVVAPLMTSGYPNVICNKIKIQPNAKAGEVLYCQRYYLSFELFSRGPVCSTQVISKISGTMKGQGRISPMIRSTFIPRAAWLEHIIWPFILFAVCGILLRSLHYHSDNISKVIHQLWGTLRRPEDMISCFI